MTRYTETAEVVVEEGAILRLTLLAELGSIIHLVLYEYKIQGLDSWRLESSFQKSSEVRIQFPARSSQDIIALSWESKAYVTTEILECWRCQYCRVSVKKGCMCTEAISRERLCVLQAIEFEGWVAKLTGAHILPSQAPDVGQLLCLLFSWFQSILSLLSFNSSILELEY